MKRCKIHLHQVAPILLVVLYTRVPATSAKTGLKPSFCKKKWNATKIELARVQMRDARQGVRYSAAFLSRQVLCIPVATFTTYVWVKVVPWWPWIAFRPEPNPFRLRSISECQSLQLRPLSVEGNESGLFLTEELPHEESTLKEASESRIRKHVDLRSLVTILQILRWR